MKTLKYSPIPCCLAAKTKNENSAQKKHQTTNRHFNFQFLLPFSSLHLRVRTLSRIHLTPVPRLTPKTHILFKMPPQIHSIQLTCFSNSFNAKTSFCIKRTQNVTERTTITATRQMEFTSTHTK